MEIGELYKRFIAGAERHLNYAATVELAHRLSVHADGLMPDKLINERRPSESEKIKEYRRKIYVPVTKKPINKVLTSLSKIRRSTDWSINYNQNDVPAILGGNTLENYCEFNYPRFTSITNWVFSELLKCYLIDANGVYATVPLNIPENAAEYISPVTYFFPSKQVFAYRAGEYAVLLSSEMSQYMSLQFAGLGLQSAYVGSQVFYIITDEIIAKYEQNPAGAGGYVPTMEYRHGLGYLPCDKVGGLFKNRQNNDIIFESRIDVMVPSLDEAAREYSDLQAEVVQHIHSEKYQYATEECPVCRGLGVSKGDDGLPCECPACKGVGRLASVSPYGEHVISLQRKLENYQIPEVPIGYVQKDTEIVKVQDARVKDHLYSALAAVNMEFLAEVPLSESGVAKEVDRDELNNFVHSIAEDIVRVMDNIYKWTCDLRYSVVIPNPDNRRALLPFISVPEQYDLLSSTHIMNEIAAMRTANANPLTINALEIDFIRKKFNANPEAANRLSAVLELDPLAGMSAEDKMTYSAENAIRKIDYVVSANIVRFVTRAYNEHRDFETKLYAEKMKILEGYAQEIIDENDAVRQTATLIMPEGF
ncbi:MAG: hypothetical protein LBS43_12570 [Prevotellaceae bacterium]|jgi:hypothetical protein|nr:hypothetical protein [Prevotellaceae bacterium]